MILNKMDDLLTTYQLEVLCDGKPLCKTGSTKKELQVDMWLANHPFYSKSQLIIDSEGRVERFMKKYGLNSTDQ